MTAVFVSGKALAAGIAGELPAASALPLTNLVYTGQTSDAGVLLRFSGTPGALSTVL